MPSYRSLITFMKNVKIAAAACIAIIVSGHGQASAREETWADLLANNSSRRIEEKNASDTPYGAIISKYARQYGVPVSLAKAVVRIESNFNAKARGRAGEIGLMQIKPATARALGYSGSVKGLYDPDTNVRFGMKYLAAAHQLGGGETCGTVLRYNAGHGAKRMNPISRRYCGKVQALLD